MLFVSACYGIDESGALVSEGLKEQTIKAVENVQKVMQMHGADLDDIVQVTIAIVGPSRDTMIVGNVLDDMFDQQPSKMTFGACWLPFGARVSIQATALVEN